MSCLRLHMKLEPIPASRHRTSKYGRTYYEDPYNTFRRTCRAALETAMIGEEMLLGPCLVYVHFIKERPGKPSYEYPTLGDGDNLEKALYDAMNKNVIDDDRHIIGAQWLKSWAAPGEPGEIHLEIISVDPVHENSEWLAEWKESEHDDLRSDPQ